MEPLFATKYKSGKYLETVLVKQVGVPKRIKPWWFHIDVGKVCFSLKYGS
jgi:hypothetical protein